MKKQNVFLVILGFMGINLISKAGSLYASAINFIKVKEGGLYLKAYLDSGGVPTIGWGSTYNFDLQRPVKMGDTITEAQAQKWITMETSQNAEDIKSLVKVPLTNNQLNSLISLVYNIGINAFKNSTLLKLLNNKSAKNIVANEFDRWVYDNGVKIQGLVNRRIAEKKLFLS